MRPTAASDEALSELILDRTSIAWRVSSDPRLYLGAGYALLLQVAHPTVGS